ncbi:LysR family transcriptional regulator [uncultured Aliiroseovarius sp.]|uniref:LysR family transcriptional regulator n=1 Tax=uncultured Aliiroseovarius sp. TaxID=1658783 RepID=UPI00260E4DCB|nr:LysR family transcriptional regulator [uncultured Aliiroseovarius sp.]
MLSKETTPRSATLVSVLFLCCSKKMKSKRWSWADLKVFLAVVREGSTLAASKKLGVTQPTVARRIEVLEHATGLILFERHNRGFSLTPVAQNLLAKAEAVEAAAKAFEDGVDELTQTKAIRLTAYSGNFSTRMIEIVNEFSSKHPGVAFEFIPSVRTLDLMKAEADIALRLTRSDPDPNLICRKVSDAKWSLFGGHTYAERFGLPTSPADLKRHKFVSFQRDDVPNSFQKWLDRNVTPEQIVATYSELDLMHAAIRSGQGLGISNVKLVETDDTLIRCFDEIEELRAQHLILVSPDAYRRPEVKAFMKFFAPRYAAIYK